MSLGIVIKGPEGLVLAAESRLTITANPQTADLPPVQINFDNVTKLMSFHEPHSQVAAVTYGQAAIGLRTANSFMPELAEALPNKRIPVKDFAQHMSTFFKNQWNATMPKDYAGPNMTFVVGGFDESAPYGSVFQFDIPRSPEPKEYYPKNGEFGINWGGQREFVDRLIQGFDMRLIPHLAEIFQIDHEKLQQEMTKFRMELPLQAMPLQDCIDLAVLFIRTTINAQRLTIGVQGCGGAIDVAVITRGKPLRFIQQKRLRGEIDETD